MGPFLPQLEPVGDGSAPAERRRAARHLLLDGFGLAAQERLAASRVVVVGAGGLGSPVLQYLAAAGVGTLGIVDDDVVDASNLQRQVLHSAADVGRAKTASATDTLRGLAPEVEVIAHRERLTRDNAAAILGGYHLVVDGSDTFETRYAVSDAAARLGLPVVWGTVLGWDGQVSVFWSAAPDGRAITYPDVFGPQPPEGESCATVGVLSPACGVVGSTMAVEAVKVLTGHGRAGAGPPAGLRRTHLRRGTRSSWPRRRRAPRRRGATAARGGRRRGSSRGAEAAGGPGALEPPPSADPGRRRRRPGVLVLDVGLRPGARPRRRVRAAGGPGRRDLPARAAGPPGRRAGGRGVRAGAAVAGRRAAAARRGMARRHEPRDPRVRGGTAGVDPPPGHLPFTWAYRDLSWRRHRLLLG